MRITKFLTRAFALLLLWAAVAGSGAATLGNTYPLDMCPADRYGSDLGCTAKDVQITNITVHQGSGAPTSCVGGSTLTLDLDVTVDFGSSTRYDVGIFLSQDGANPQLRSTRTTAAGTGSASCKVAILPSPPPPATAANATYPFPNDSTDMGPYVIGGVTYYDTCGDGSTATVGGGTGTATFTITGVNVICKSIDASGALNIPFVVTWDNQNSTICTSAANPVPNTTSKCNAPSGTQGNVAVVTVPTITKSNFVSSISPGDTTTYTISVYNNTGIALSNLIFKDPAVTNLTATAVTCTAQSATCPTPANTTVPLMQGSGITIPQIPVGGTVTFTVDALLTGNPTGSLVNKASVTTSTGAVNTATDTDTIVYPSLVNTKTVSIVSDPVNGTNNPKYIPGSEALYTITVTNQGLGRVDSGTVQIVDPIPANTILFVGNLGGSPAGPVTFSAGTSGLTFTYTSLAATTDDLEFYDGTTWNYTPVADANGYDANVKSIRISPKGRMAGWSGSGAYPSFSFSFKVKLN